MKYFVICSILCFAGVQGVFHNIASEEAGERKLEPAEIYVRECAEEHNLPSLKNPRVFVGARILSGFFPAFENDKITCATACFARKMMEKQGFTIRTGLFDYIDTTYQQGLGSSKTTVEELKSKVENCYAKERDECEFFKCIDMQKPPFSYLDAAKVKKSAVLAGIRYFAIGH